MTLVYGNRLMGRFDDGAAHRPPFTMITQGRRQIVTSRRVNTFPIASADLRQGVQDTWPELLAISYAILVNGLALLGMAFILSLAFPWLRTRSDWQRTIILSVAFSAMTLGTMMMSYSLGPGFISDLRHVVIAVAAIVGGPVPALIAALAAAAYRIHSGGQWTAGLLGIAVTTGLSIGFSQ